MVIVVTSFVMVMVMVMVATSLVMVEKSVETSSQDSKLR